MAAFKCNKCNKEVGENMHSCSYCGQVLCGDCSGKSFNLCSTCYGEMKYLH